MSESQDKLSIIEIIGVGVMLVGLCAGLAAWWSGQSLWDSGMQVFVFLLAGGLIILTGEGFHTGKLGIRGGYVYRDKQPVPFWGCAVFYIAVALFLLSVLALNIFVGE